MATCGRRKKKRLYILRAKNSGSKIYIGRGRKIYPNIEDAIVFRSLNKAKEVLAEIQYKDDHVWWIKEVEKY